MNEVLTVWRVHSEIDILIYLVVVALAIAVTKVILLRQAEQTVMNASQTRLAAIVEFSDDAIISLDLNGVIQSWNASAERLFNYRQEEIVGQSVTLLLPPEQQDEEELVLQRLQAGERTKRFDTVRIAKDGRRVDVSVTCSPLTFNSGKLTSVSEIIRDNTERKQAEEKLRESEEKFRNLFNNAEVGMYRTTLDGSEILDANQKYLDIVGKTREEIIGKPSATNWVDPKEREKLVRMLVANGRVSGFEYIKVNQQSGVKSCLTSLVLYREQGILEGTILDISERKQAEEEKAKLEAQLHQAQKMESVGRLAGGVAHDFNNMLSVIIGYSELILMKLEPSEPIYASLCEIRTAAERSADITRQLLAFARKQTIAPKVIDLNETVSGMLKMLQRFIGEDISLTWQPSPDLWPVKIDPTQIDQMLANLCVNARDAIADVGKLTIETENRAIDENYCALNLGFMPGEYVCFSVSDNGCGMDKETVTHIFEPFYTTKAPGKGTGLGLATVYGIVKQNNGFINIYSEPGQGTTFTIYLPRHIGESGQALIEKAVKPISSGNETILLVEDEPSILDMTALMLEGMGYTVEKSRTAIDAIRLFKELPGKIHLLMTDVVMPDMNGRNLVIELRSINPQLRCLFMSGYTANVIAHHGVLDEGVHFIQKPFSLPILATKLREVLDREADGQF